MDCLLNKDQQDTRLYIHKNEMIKKIFRCLLLQFLRFYIIKPRMIITCYLDFRWNLSDIYTMTAVHLDYILYFVHKSTQHKDQI